MMIALYGRAFSTDQSGPVKEMIALLQLRNVKLAIYRPFYNFLHENYQIDLSGANSFDHLPPAGTDCLISIGGDGTFLRSLQHVADSNIPVVGINLGRLGFLSAASFDSLPETIDAILEKKYTIEARTLLQVKSDALPQNTFAYALNEVGIQRHSPAMIGIHVRLNDNLLPTYWSDGLLIATPTGSTAYSMSVGGPIVVPQCNNLVLSPIAPHNLNVRSLVIPDDTLLTMTVETRDGHAFLTIDNQLFEINSGAHLTINKAPFALRVVRLHGTNFFEAIREKLSWGKDLRN